MKKILILILLVACAFVYAEIPEPHSLQLTTDLALYFPSASYSMQGDNHKFNLPSGIYNGLDLRSTLDYEYIIPVPFGDNPLVAGNTLRPGAAFEVTPTSLALEGKVAFSPIAFLDFNVGALISSGWFLPGFNVNGLAILDQTETNPDQAYKNTAFSELYHRFWAEGIFQFDLAAIIPGDWNHVVTRASYVVQYIGVTGSEGNSWIWQGRGSTDYEQANGLQYYATTLLGYQMPLRVNLVGIAAEYWGAYSREDYKDIAGAEKWNPTYVHITISPVASIELAEKHNLFIQLRFGSRRVYNVDYDHGAESVITVVRETPGMYQTGREWFLDRLALSYNVKF